MKKDNIDIIDFSSIPAELKQVSVIVNNCKVNLFFPMKTDNNLLNEIKHTMLVSSLKMQES